VHLHQSLPRQLPTGKKDRLILVPLIQIQEHPEPIMHHRRLVRRDRADTRAIVPWDPEEIREPVRRDRADIRAAARWVKGIMQVRVRRDKADIRATVLSDKVDIKAIVRQVKVDIKAIVRQVKADIKAIVLWVPADIRAAARQVKADIKAIALWVPADTRAVARQVKADTRAIARWVPADIRVIVRQAKAGTPRKDLRRAVLADLVLRDPAVRGLKAATAAPDPLREDSVQAVRAMKKTRILSVPKKTMVTAPAVRQKAQPSLIRISRLKSQKTKPILQPEMHMKRVAKNLQKKSRKMSASPALFRAIADWAIKML